MKNIKLLTLIAITVLMSCKKGGEPEPENQMIPVVQPPPSTQKFIYTWRWKLPNETLVHYEEWCATADSTAKAVKDKDGWNVMKGGTCQ